MKQKTSFRLLPLMLTLALGLFLTVFYISKTTTENVPCIEKNCTSQKKPQGQFMIWQSLSRHLLSIGR